MERRRAITDSAHTWVDVRITALSRASCERTILKDRGFTVTA